MKISKSKSNNKTLKNPFNFDSIKNSFWLHVLKHLKANSHNKKKKLSNSFWEKFTLLHLPYENF